MFLDNFFHKKTPIQTHAYRSIALSFFGLSAVIAVIVFYISFSWATIRIVPDVKPFTASAKISLTESGLAGEGMLTGKIIQKELVGTGTFSATAAETKVGRLAGTITVANLTGRSQALRETTRFLTPNGTLFRSTQSVVVPAGRRVDVPVQADKEGELGVLDTSRFTIPGLWQPLQKDIYGASFTQTRGASQEVKKVTQGDVTRAEEEVGKKLHDKFSLMLDAEKPSLDAPSVGALFRSDVVERSADHPVGDTTDEFTVTLKLRFTAALYNDQEMVKRLAEVMTGNLSSGYQLLPLRPDQISGTVDAYDPTAKTAALSVAAAGGKIRNDDIQPYHTRDLAGLKKDAIIEYFRGYDDIKDVSVSFSPFWVTRAPLLTDHIKILVDKSAQ